MFSRLICFFCIGLGLCLLLFGCWFDLVLLGVGLIKLLDLFVGFELIY